MPKEKSIKEIEDLPGIGPATAEKLRSAGYATLDKIAVASPFELSELVGISSENAKKAVEAGRPPLPSRSRQHRMCWRRGRR